VKIDIARWLTWHSLICKPSSQLQPLGSTSATTFQPNTSVVPSAAAEPNNTDSREMVPGVAGAQILQVTSSDHKHSRWGEWACTLMVGLSSGTVPTMVQILVLAPFTGFILGFSGVMH
jgi:hypothetical protein